jgi:hypothetical protein
MKLTDEKILEIAKRVSFDTSGKDAEVFLVAFARALLAAQPIDIDELVHRAWHEGHAAGLARAAQPIDAEPVAHKLLAGLIDILDDGLNNAPEHRCYVEGAWNEALDEARAYLAAPPSKPVDAEPVVNERHRFDRWFRDGETAEFWENATPLQIANAAWYAALDKDSK